MCTPGSPKTTSTPAASRPATSSSAPLRATSVALADDVAKLLAGGVPAQLLAGSAPQPDYLNAVVELSTSLSPTDLLAELKAVEARVGRTPAERWGPREIDLDLLLYGEEEIEDGRLRVPHPEMAARAFVLVPLHDLAPDAVVPGKGCVSELLTAVGRDGVRGPVATLSSS